MERRKINGIRANAKEAILKTPYDKLSGERLADLRKEESHIERQFIIGIIVDDNYCKWAAENFSIKLLKATMAKTFASWVYKYYSEYQKAPFRDMEGIFYDQLKKSNLPKELAEEIEQDILPNLNDDYLKNFKSTDFQYLLKRSELYLNTRRAERQIEEGSALIENNEVEEALNLLNIEPITGNTINKFIKTVKEMEDEGVEKPRTLMKPWLREGETTLLYSEAGVGKSLLAMLVAYVLGLENFDEYDISEWQVKQPTGTLYIDGELGGAEMIDRLNRYTYLGSQQKELSTQILSIPDYQIKAGKDFDLSKRENQRTIIGWLKGHPNYKFLIIDSISTVFNLESENDNSEWNKKINPFIRDLRGLGVAHIIQHHAGKDNKKGLRGASAMSAMAHNIIRLTNHEDKETGSAWFKVDNREKQRAAGKLYSPFYIKFTALDDRTEFEITEGERANGSDKTDRIRCMILGRSKTEDIKQRFSVGDSWISQMRKKMVEEGLLNADKRTPTEKGMEYLKEMEDE